ncbi:mitochondrial outer membrane protein [Scheffersomyces coipomensis]|uniref:mitochondrial outer membrane protein n=1 Tax=Scheffersomyces coipomensis TaxID=1788519 RepID=UPI00315D1C26
MSFNVNWESLDTDSLINWTKDLLTSALNSGKTPNILASNIQIKDLNFGKIAPNFEILEIGELDSDRFRGIFKINYDGDFHLTLHTNVQANPLNIYYSNSLEYEINESNPFITPQFLLSNEQFALPLDLKLSDIKISGIGIIVFSKSKGLTMVFRNDPLDSIKVSSTFDTVQVLANFLQNQIENQIRDLFRDTLPTLIHQFSLKYLDLDKLNEFATMSTNHEQKQSTQTSNQSTDEVNPVGLQLTNEDESIKTIIYSSKNLQKNLKLFNSRETLDLNIIKFKNVIQRSHLDKFTKTYPNLLNSLCSNINDLTIPVMPITSSSTNGIPIELLVNKNFNKIDNIMEEISNIQSINYYKLNNEKSSTTNNIKPTLVKPKRRKIKYNRHKKAPSPTIVPAISIMSTTNTSLPQSVDISHASSLYSTNDLLSETSTLINIDSNLNSVPISSVHSTLSTNDDIIIHPKPIRIAHDKLYQEILKSSESDPYHPSHHHHHHSHPLKSHTYETIVVAPPPPSTTSLLSGVGIGNNYFNFTNLNNSQTSPIKSSHGSLKEEKKSMNYIDINKINDKLRKLSLEQKQQRERLIKSHYEYSGHGLFENAPTTLVQPPPPYYH